MKMPFGKHKGTEIEELPSDYIAWLLTQDWLQEPKNANILNAIKAVQQHGPGEVTVNSAKVATVYRELMNKYFTSKLAQEILTEFKDRLLL